MNNKQQEKVGDIFECVVKDLTSDGRGVVSHPSGRTYFVPGVWLNEKITVKIKEIKGRTGFAQCLEILEPCAYRVEARCSHHGFGVGECGACPWQSIDYAAQLEAKQTRVNDSLSRLGLKEKVKPIYGTAQIFSYRNRAQFKSDGASIGYVSAQSNDLAPIQDCPILTDRNRNTLYELIAQLPNKSWQPQKKQRWVTLDIDHDIDAIDVSVNKRRPFRQANDIQNTYMREWLVQKLSVLDKKIQVLELFCGSGNFTEVIVEHGFEHITAVDVAGDAIDILSARGFGNVTTVSADLFSELGFTQALNKAKQAEVLVLEPPRDGLKIKGDIFAKKSKLKHIFYISCDLATLTRDINIFTANRYKVMEVQPLDQVPHTPHIECLVYLKKKSQG